MRGARNDLSARPSVSAKPANRRRRRVINTSVRSGFGVSREIAPSNAIVRRLSTLNWERERERRRRGMSRVASISCSDYARWWLWENDLGAKEARRAVIKSVKLVIRRGFAHALACVGSTFVSRSHLVHTAAIAISRCKARPPRRAVTGPAASDFLEIEKCPRFLLVSRHELNFRHRWSTTLPILDTWRTGQWARWLLPTVENVFNSLLKIYFKLQNKTD